MTSVVYPKKIVEQKNIKDSYRLFEKRDLTVGVVEGDYITVDKSGGFIVLDFGKEMCGGIRILTALIPSESKTGKIRLRFGESLSEVYAELGEKNTTNDHAPRDFDYVICGHSDLKIGDTGYRFVRIDFYPCDADILLKTIVGTNTILKMPCKYRYQGEDKRIKKIFDTAKRTLDLCSGSSWVWDGIKRDRLVWIGDLYPEILSLCTMYGRVGAVEKSLDFERRRHKYKGKWMCSLSTYNMWWVICVCEYYFMTGAKDFLDKLMDYLAEQIELFNESVGENGELKYEFLYVDWPTMDHEDKIIGSRFINIIAAKKAKELYTTLGLDTAEIDRLLAKLMKSDMKVKEKKQVIGLKYYALGSITDEEYALLIKDGASGLSTFMSYFILGAIASRDKALAIKIMKDYYGAMLDKGATTFWEDFDIEWTIGSGRIDRLPKPGEKDIHGDFGKYCYKGFRHSLCHAWSSGVIKFIEEYCK